MRRSHRKSRNGCAQCKRRHIKCDESKPQCVNCSTAGKTDCLYLSKSPKMFTSDISYPGHGVFTPSADSSASPNSSCDSSLILPSGSLPTDYVNLVHLELFHHLWLESGTTFFGQDASKDFALSMIHRALDAPFLLYELLAISALHLSFEKPEKVRFYRDEATKLQVNALRLYNSTVIEINDSNLLAAFIFSGTLGLHFFCEVFVTPADNLEGFLDQLVQSIKLLRGVRAHFTGRWEQIANSEISPLLQAEKLENADHTDEVVQQLEDLIVAINHSFDLSPDQTKVIEDAVKSLCWVYKAQVAPEESDGDQNPRMVTSWPIIVSEEFTSLLEERKPEAIVVLAYFSVILHKCRNWWAVGGSGRFLLGALEIFLGTTWNPWLAWPKSIVYDTV